MAAENAMGLRTTMNYRAVPRCIFSIPEVGAVGLTEEAARKEHGEEVLVGKFPLAAEAALAISAELTLDELIAAIHAHPTVAETIREAALAAAKRRVFGKKAEKYHPT